MKSLERNCSKTGRIVAKAKFTSWVFLLDCFVGVVLGGLVAVLWIFADQIEAIFTKQEQPAQYLTEANLRWVVVGVACFMALFVIIHSIVHSSKELVMTEDQIVYRKGFFKVKMVAIPLAKIKLVETRKSLIQRILGFGRLELISDAGKPYCIKYVKQVDTFSRRVMKQIRLEESVGSKAISIRFAK